MQQNLLIAIACLLSLSLMGCQVTHPNATAGGLLGGTTGGILGAAIGSHEGKTKEGALIGALAGGLTGSVIGNQADAANARQQQFEYEQAQAAQRAAVSLDQVVEMSRSGLSPELIINQIKTSGIDRPITTDDIISLKSAGVADNVIRELQTAGTRMNSPVYRVPELRAPQPIIVDDPYYPGVYHEPVIIRHHPRYHHRGRARNGFSFHF